ncbi:MAG: hypothetical protein OXF07_07825, partial [Rhodobacter sp.]|nr:hypothetical protein [Rhodobacter sp.]
PTRYPQSGYFPASGVSSELFWGWLMFGLIRTQGVMYDSIPAGLISGCSKARARVMRLCETVDFAGPDRLFPSFVQMPVLFHVGLEVDFEGTAIFRLVERAAHVVEVTDLHRHRAVEDDGTGEMPVAIKAG